MAEAKEMELVILWEEEIRTAANYLQRVVALSKKQDRTDDELAKAYADALNACAAALLGAESETAGLLLSSSRTMRLRPKKDKTTNAQQ